MKKKRKPMTEEQRLAAAERLRIAREKRGHDGSASVHPDLLSMDEDSPIHWKKVRGWVKELTSELSSKKRNRLSKDKGERQEYQILDVYLKNLKSYLSTGIYMDSRYGRNREGKMKMICLTMAYYPDGTPKRTIGTWYPDIGRVWTQELRNEWYGGNEPRRVHERKLPEQEEVLIDGGDGSSDELDVLP
jgi:hypothetical protein